MATHQIPDDGAVHAPTFDCPCKPGQKRRRRPDGYAAMVIVHNELPAVDQGSEVFQ